MHMYAWLKQVIDVVYDGDALWSDVGLTMVITHNTSEYYLMERKWILKGTGNDP